MEWALNTPFGLYFPSNIPMGKYDVTTYKIKDGEIISSNKKKYSN